MKGIGSGGESDQLSAAGIIDAVSKFCKPFGYEQGKLIIIRDVGSHKSVSKLVGDGTVEIRKPVVGSTVNVVGGDGGVIRHGDLEVEGGGIAATVIRVIDGGEGFIIGIGIEGDIQAFDGGAAFFEREPVRLLIKVDGALDPPVIQALNDILLNG